ncbi:MAG: DUF262 domain-containing protein [Burkholderiaceae bacterium]|nr:DUF262 domain-containing protein [Burkholderiaceae bacterium]
MKTKPLYQILDDLNREIYLPHIQRPFVWGDEQVRKLLDSLLRGYPIQTLLFWRTRDGIRARRFMDVVTRDVDLHTLYDSPASEEGADRLFVLDGQQRLQALRTLFDGQIESENDTKLEAWIDLASGHEQDNEGFWYGIKFAAVSPGVAWYRLRNLRGVNSKTSGAALGRQEAQKIEPSLTGAAEQIDATLDRVQENATSLIRILREDGVFWYDELDGVVNDYPYERVLEVFVRVNNGGTKLDAGDLMFAAMKGLSGDIEEQVEEIASQLGIGDLTFDKAWVLKTIVLTLTGSATLGPKLFSGKSGEALMSRVVEDWSRIEAAFQQLHDLLQNDIGVTTDRLVRSYLALVPVVDYLYHFPGPDPAQRQRIVGYFHKAQLFNWFSASTDQLLAGLHSKITSSGKIFPLEEIKTFFVGYRRDVELTEGNIGGSRVRAMVLNLVYREKFDASLFQSQFPGNAPHVDHIYPRARLKELGLSGDDINHLGNFRFVGAKDNIRKRAEHPGAHFTRMKTGKVPVEKHLLAEPWASDPTKLALDIDTYLKFRDSRASAILTIAQQIVNPENVS